MDIASLPLPRFVADSALSRYLHRLFVGHLFHRYFLVVPADNDLLRAEVYRIRFDVYCRELGWESMSRYPDGQEKDPYDALSLHSLLLHRHSNTYAGCVRLVRPDPANPDAPLPFEKLCAGRLWTHVVDPAALDRTKLGEISRLAVRAQFRKRPGEMASAEGSLPDKMVGDRHRRTPPIAMGLYLAAAASGLLTGMEGVFALMEPRLAKRLNSYGIAFTQIGDPVEHRGMRAPFYITRSALYERISPLVRGFLDVVLNDLKAARGWEVR